LNSAADVPDLDALLAALARASALPVSVAQSDAQVRKATPQDLEHLRHAAPPG
jgi:hypothetical protein